MIQLKEEIPNWLTSYIEKSNLNSFVIGISGGIDSAVTSTLCAMTGKKTFLLIMPIHQNQDETNRGIDHCNWNDNFIFNSWECKWFSCWDRK